MRPSYSQPFSRHWPCPFDAASSHVDMSKRQPFSLRYARHTSCLFGRFFTRVQVPWTTLFSGVPKALQVAVGRGVLTYRLVPWTAPVVCVLKALELSIGSRQHAYGSRPWEPVTFIELPVT
ncbi:unnamed protein product, partial [Macrosiphum euphorbiae]